MSVRAKFFVQSVSAYATGNGSVVLAPATRGSENKQWASATPSGKIELTINNPKAWEWYRDHLSEEVYVDFSLVPENLTDPAKHRFVEETDQSHYNRGRCVHCSMEPAAHKEA